MYYHTLKESEKLAEAINEQKERAREIITNPALSDNAVNKAFDLNKRLATLNIDRPGSEILAEVEQIKMALNLLK